METEVREILMERAGLAPRAKNWAQQVSLGDAFMLLLKFAIASIPFWIALLFLSPLILDTVRAFFSGFYGERR